MADVGDRGQLILVTGLLIAVVLIALALVVNGAIYTENLSTRDSGGDTQESLEQRHGAGDDLQALIDSVNSQITTDDYGTVEGNLISAVSQWNRSRENRYVQTGHSVTTQLKSTNEGTRIRQEDYNRNLTAGGSIVGQQNWTLVDGVTNTSEFDGQIQRASLLDATDETLDAVSREAFNIQIVTASGDRWRVFMFRGAATGTGYLLVEDPGEDFENSTDGYAEFINNSCTYGGADIEFDMLNGTWGGDDCDQLGFYNDSVVGESHEISYRNARSDGGVLFPDEDRAEGNYSLIVDTRADRAPYHDYDPSNQENPYAFAVVHGITVDIQFRSKELTFDSQEVSVQWSAVT